jgi:glyoxylase-like metal-dependent hydrolase (beta-lactamase superfamily II)
MAGADFPLQLGDWRLDLLECGRFALDGGAMFGSVPRLLWENLIPPDPQHRIPLAMRLLLLRHRTANHIVLVDAGIGAKFDPRFQEMFAVQNPPAPRASSPLESTPLAGVLASAGVRVVEVTHVVLTHLHFDHAGGATVRAGGDVVPQFPRAEHFLQRANLDEARAPNPRERASYLADNVEPLASAARLTLLDGAAEVLPGLSVEPSDGHTRGLHTLRVEGGGRAVYYVADLAPTSHHVHLPYTMGYDLCVRTILEEKRRLWDRAIAEEAIIVFEHDPYVRCGRMEVEGGRYRIAARAP